MHETETFIYNPDDLLGKGATSEVYKGISKKGGSFCALKVFKKQCKSAWKTIEQELDILSKIRHENIVQIFGMEVDLTGRPILIMEYLNRGTLFDQLREPKNMFGFNDWRFLSLLKDIAAGLTQLQIAGIIHRDIKPNNILRSVVPEGREIYKLSDFGTAKIVSNQDELESIVGTEEYVHPAVFERIQTGKKAKMTSVQSLDPWSLGITLYHVATGHLPFQTKEGMRKNRMCRLQMLKEKPSGVISAKVAENGEITWLTELPSTCLLSRSLSKLIVNSMSRLLETDEKKSWTIAEFLTNAETIFSKVPVHVIQPSHERMEIFYLNPESTIPHLKEAIALEWEVPGYQQMLFHGCIDFNLPLVAWSISEYPRTRPEHPVILIEKSEKMDITIPVLDIEPIRFPRDISTHDSSIAAQMSAQIYKIVRRVRHHRRINDCLVSIVGILNSKIASEIRITQLLMSSRTIKHYTTKLELESSFESFIAYPNMTKYYENIKNVYKEAVQITKHIKSRPTKRSNFYYDVSDRNYLNALFEAAKKDFEEHKNLFAETMEKFREWQSKNLKKLETISKMKNKLIKEAAITKIYQGNGLIKKYLDPTNQLITNSNHEKKRLLELNSDFEQLIFSFS